MISDHFGVGEERAHAREFVFDADHPAVLVGQDEGRTPVEFIRDVAQRDVVGADRAV